MGKSKEGNTEKIVFKGPPGQLKKLLGNLLHPSPFGPIPMPRRPLPMKADGLFSRKYREKFLLHSLRLCKDELRDSSNIERKKFDEHIGFMEKALNEDGTRKLSPEVIAEAWKMIAELKQSGEAKFKKE